MGWCFGKIGDVIEGFEKLDKEKPYDNGLSYKDVNETRIVSCGKEGLVAVVTQYHKLIVAGTKWELFSFG
jgi:uncharacterized protein YacL (UPF0231 family)